jgi:hypothetical protein
MLTFGAGRAKAIGFISLMILAPKFRKFSLDCSLWVGASVDLLLMFGVPR